ncbi:MAG TPA: hypothetical protein DEW10_05010 [Bifidobacterium sp.]|nr:hypothetical protein [Bifidobacterium sp.]HCA74769.1 hypothetical protein [Bifidobacterium sp.]HCH22103.1 hypothetical protein [Bifidobacterium sp.]
MIGELGASHILHIFGIGIEFPISRRRPPVHRGLSEPWTPATFRKLDAPNRQRGFMAYWIA